MLLQLLVVAPAALAVIILHELAHGYAALWLGDDTARRKGRLSFNPLRHVDRVGTILLPAGLIIGQLAMFHDVKVLFGWAKPVPVAAWRFRDPRRGMALVAAAGPAANMLLAWLGALAVHGLGLVPEGAAGVVGAVLEAFILSNLVLGLFNLLPIPPLDGGRIMVGLLPAGLAAHWARLERAGLLLVVLLVVSPLALGQFGIAFSPLGAAIDVVLPRAFELVCRLAFLDV